MPAPPRRKDAARNWERIVSVAREMVDGGEALQLNEVARRAGVGVATVYRHFPHPEALLETVATPALESLIRHGERALADDNASRSLADFLARTVEAQLGDPSLSAVAAATMDTLEQTTHLKKTLWTVGGRLLERAHKAGVVRPGVTAGDLVPLMCGIAYAAAAHDEDPTRRTHTAHRYLTVLLTGLLTSGGPSRGT
jgi:AcrR family transcriptional regulator